MRPERPGIVAALPGEVQALARLPAGGEAEPGGGIRLVLSGMGGVRAAAAARRLAESGVDALISWGSAAALDVSLSPGDLVLPEVIVTGDGRYDTDRSWRLWLVAALGDPAWVSQAPLADSPQILSDVEQKRALQLSTRALAADMESAGVASVAQAFGLPFIAVRAIADDAGMVLPAAARVAVNDSGRLQPWAMLGALVSPPATLVGQLRALYQLGRAFRAARTTLARVAPLLVKNEP